MSERKCHCILQIIINIIVFILILGTIVVVHEFGHFIAAQLFHVYCGAFSIGMGPVLYRRKGKETEFQIRALPIGGFVTMAGEADQEESDEFKDVPLERSLKGKKTYQKIIIFLAGIFNNFLLAIIIMLAYNFTVGMVPLEKPTVGTIVENSAAAKYGLAVGDELIAIENNDSHVVYQIKVYDDLTKILTPESQKITADSTNVTLTIRRDGKTQKINLVLPFNTASQRYQLGISEGMRRMKASEVLPATFGEIARMALLILTALKQLVLNFSSTVKQMSGPVGIYTITSSVASSGRIAELFYLMAMLSVNIGVFNLMPIPGLDGAQALIALVEGVIRRDVPMNLKLGLQLAGLALVLFLMFYITFQDISRLLH